jgi:hypothetical protein
VGHDDEARPVACLVQRPELRDERRYITEVEMVMQNDWRIWEVAVLEWTDGDVTTI